MVEPSLALDVDSDVDVPPHQFTANHTNRGSGAHGTAPNDMGHDGTALWAEDYETAARLTVGLFRSLYTMETRLILRPSIGCHSSRDREYPVTLLTCQNPSYP